MRINVGFLVNQQIGTSRDFHFSIPQIVLNDFEVADFEGVARISRTPQGLLVQADFKGYVKTECVRCLVEFPQSLVAEFHELFAFNQKSLTDSGLLMPENGHIDLAPLVREYLLLEMPISPLCKPDCKGLCTICGEDLNTTTCEHVVQAV